MNRRPNFIIELQCESYRVDIPAVSVKGMASGLLLPDGIAEERYRNPCTHSRHGRSQRKAAPAWHVTTAAECG